MDREHLALLDAAKWFRVFLHCLTLCGNNMINNVRYIRYIPNYLGFKPEEERDLIMLAKDSAKWVLYLYPPITQCFTDTLITHNSGGRSWEEESGRLF